MESAFECKDDDSSIRPDSIQFSEVSGCIGSSDYGSVSDADSDTIEFKQVSSLDYDDDVDISVNTNSVQFSDVTSANESLHHESSEIEELLN
jgi:hypothetical protein